MKSTLFLSATLAHVASADSHEGKSKILIVGDSMGAYACNYIQGLCGGSTVTNKAISGSTAWSWGAGGSNAGALTEAVDAAGGEPTHIWLSVGGNDYMNPGEMADAPGGDAGPCKISQADLNTRMQKAVTNVRAAAPSAKIVLTGYCVPTVPECGGADMTKMQVAGAKMVTDNSNVAYVDISGSCGGSSPNTKSDKQYFVDGIHLNQRGYCNAFSAANVQTAFACSAGADPSTCSDVAQATCEPSAGVTLRTSLVAAAATVVATILAIVH
jgi:lysophospholipase L1-like esterase